MSTIVSLTPISSIKVGPGSTVAPDGTILNPERYEAVDILFDDGVAVQVERPLDAARVRAAYQAAIASRGASLDGISTGDVV